MPLQQQEISTRELSREKMTTTRIDWDERIESQVSRELLYFPNTIVADYDSLKWPSDRHERRQ